MSTPNLSLYYYPTCPFCIRVIFFLKRKGIDIPLKNIIQNMDDREALMAGGGKTQVPCLRIEDESGHVEWLYESDDIVDYLQSTYI